MVFEVLRGCAQIAADLTEVTASRARVMVRDLLAEEGVSDPRAPGGLADEMLAVSRAGRARLGTLARERLLDTFDLATADELTRLRERVAELEHRLAAPATGHTAGAPSATVKPTARTPRSRTAGAAPGKPARKTTMSTPGGDA